MAACTPNSLTTDADTDKHVSFQELGFWCFPAFGILFVKKGLLPSAACAHLSIVDLNLLLPQLLCRQLLDPLEAVRRLSVLPKV